MKRFKQTIAIVLGATMLTSVAVFGEDANTANQAPLTSVTDVAQFPTPLPTGMGKIIEKTANQITFETGDERFPELTLNISPETAAIDNTTGLPLNLDSLKQGDTIFAYFSEAMTRSIPPQSSATAIIGNIQKNTAPAKYITVGDIIESTNSGITVISADNQYQITIPADLTLMPYKTKQIVTLQDIKVGTPLFAWFEFMTLSIPAQATATKVVVLPTPAGTVTENEKKNIIINEVGQINAEEFLGCVLKTINKSTGTGTYTQQALALGLVTQEEITAAGNQPITRAFMYNVIEKVTQGNFNVNPVELEYNINQLLVNGIEINDEILNMTDSIPVKNGNLMVPLRQVAEKLGFTVGWDAATSSVSLTKGNVNVSFALGVDKYTKDSTAHTLNTPPTLIDSKTYVPLSLFKLLLPDQESVIVENGKIIFNVK